MAHLTCVACGRRLTRDCRLGTFLEDFTLDAQDRAPSVQVGVIVQLEGHELDAVTVVRGIVTNPADVLLDELKYSGKYYGCCGVDGSDGPNRSCVHCNAVVATEWSDCWTQAEIRFLPEAVRLSP
jgi:hypothetical protein